MTCIHDDTVVTSDTCNSGQSENYEDSFTIFVQELETFYKMVYKNFVFWLILSWEIALQS